MATISKVRRLTNPGMFSKVKRKLSPLQKMFFGSKRQRAAIANSGKGRTLGQLSKKLKSKRYRLSKVGSVIKRKRNVGSIITVWPKGHSNPGGKVKRWRRKGVRKAKPVAKRNGGAKNRLVIVNPGGRMAKGSGWV